MQSETNNTEVNILVGGEAGQGLVTIGQMLARSLVRAGFSVCVTQSYQSRIRGGHNTFAVRAGTHPVACPRETFDLLVALNTETLLLHESELAAKARVVLDAGAGVPKHSRDDITLFPAPLGDLAQSRYMNTAALGIAAGLVGLGEDLVGDVLEEAFGKKDAGVARANREALAGAYAWCRTNAGGAPLLPGTGPFTGMAMLHGNEAIARGALSAGLGFLSYYPMTPSTSVAMGIIANAGARGDVIVEQAEDEIAAINMAIGASFAGRPSMVTTSGGGFALMEEGVSLSAMTETPVVVVLAQRPGPATGLPTRTEQGDLELVLYAGHGEFPRAIFAPGTVEDCFRLTRRAFEMAEVSQGPVFLLTDQFLADSFRAVAPLEPSACPSVAGDEDPMSGGPYRRYAFSESGRSPRVFPGHEGRLVVADSDEHTEDGHLTEDLGIRPRMVGKRLAKERLLRENIVPASNDGPDRPDVLFVSWGSTRGAVLEAAEKLRQEGVSIGNLHFSQVWPLDRRRILPVLENAGRVICVEGNATGQFARVVHRETGFLIEHHIRRYDGLPFTPEFILRAFEGVGHD